MPVAVIVFVEDVARSLDFYERVVGAELDHYDEPRRCGSRDPSRGAARRCYATSTACSSTSTSLKA